MEIKTSDVTKFLSYIITMSSLDQYSIDDDKYIIDSKDEKMSYGSPPRSVLLYQQTIKDPEAYVLNPFVEGVKENNISRWFYTLTWKGLSARILAVMNFVINRAVLEHNYSNIKVAAKQKAFVKEFPEIEESIPAPVQKLISSIINNVDEKVIQEFSDLNDHIKKMNKTNHIFLCIYYRRKMLTSSVDIPIITDDEYQYPRSIRKGTQALFKTLLMRIFDIKSPEELDKLTVKARDDASAKIDSQINCLFNIFSTINEVLDIISDKLSIDLSELKDHIDKLPAYSKNARGAIFASPSEIKSSEPENRIPGLTSSPTTESYVPSHSSEIPGPMKIDGSREPNVSIYNPHLTGYAGPGMVPSPQPVNTFTPSPFHHSPFQPNSSPFGQPMMGGFNPSPFGNFNNNNVIAPGFPSNFPFPHNYPR